MNQWPLVLTGISIAIAVAGAVASMLAAERRAATVAGDYELFSAAACSYRRSRRDDRRWERRTVAMVVSRSSDRLRWARRP